MQVLALYDHDLVVAEDGLRDLSLQKSLLSRAVRVCPIVFGLSSDHLRHGVFLRGKTSGVCVVGASMLIVTFVHVQSGASLARALLVARALLLLLLQNSCARLHWLVAARPLIGEACGLRIEIGGGRMGKAQLLVLLVLVGGMAVSKGA